MKTIFTITLFFVLFPAFSQYTITQSGHGFFAGDSFTFQALDTSNLRPGNSGANIIWDFSTLVPSTSPYSVFSLTFLPEYSCPGYTNFPEATVCQIKSGGSSGNMTYNFHKISNSATEELGSYSTYTNSSTAWTIASVYIDPSKSLVFPFNYGDSYIDTYSSITSNSNSTVTTTNSGTFSVKYDGIGTLKLPGDLNLYNTARVIHSQSTTSNRVTLYMYYSSISKYPLIVIYEDYSFVSQNTFYDGSYNRVIPLNAKETSPGSFSFNLYPNPSNGNSSVNFTTKAETSVEIEILNELSQIVKTFNIKTLHAGTHYETINLTELDDGLYYLKIKSNNSEGILKLVILK